MKSSNLNDSPSFNWVVRLFVLLFVASQVSSTVTWAQDQCWSLQQSSVVCDAANPGNYTLTATLQNSSGFSGAHAFVVGPGTPILTPDHFDLSGLPPGGVTNVTLQISGGSVGETVCFQLTLHDETLGECCSTELCITLPACGEIEFVRGDCNGDGGPDIGDPIFLLSFLFPGGGVPPVLACVDACDCNDDGLINIADAIYKLTALFANGPPPPPPNPGCGADPTVDALDCASYPPCP